MLQQRQAPLCHMHGAWLLASPFSLGLVWSGHLAAS
uniref:Uncharacterized protein n=1 Tax=Arundo donax TaxID=35708 RepID=A0A0A9A3S8_ARUDO